MKKSSFFLALSFLLSFYSAQAQSTDIDKEPIEINYVRLPEKPVLNDANRTFSVLSLNSEVLTQSLPELYFESEIKLSGFTKLNNDAFIAIQSKLIDVTLISNDIDSTPKSRTDKDGKVTRWTEYKTIIKYRTEGSVTVTSADQSINEVFTFNGNKTKSSKVFDNYESARAFRNSNAIKTLRINFIKNVISTVNSRISSLFGYKEIKSKKNLWVLDSKKHPEYENHKTNFKIVEEAFSKMKSYESLDNLKLEVKPALDYYKSILSKYEGKDRKSKKLRYASLYNIGWINYYLDNPDETATYGAKIIENDYDKADGKSLDKKAIELRDVFAINKTNTRHLKILTEDKTDYYGASSNQFIDANDPDKSFDPKTDPDYSLSFVITNSGDTIPGYINMKKIDKLAGILKTYVKDLEGKPVLRNFGAHEVNTLVLGNGEKRYTLPFKEADDAVTMSSFDRASYKYVKRIYASKKINLYEYQSRELIIKKNTDKKGYSTSSSGWLMAFRKKLGNLLGEDCPELKERVKEKEFENNANSIVEFIKAYENCEK